MTEKTAIERAARALAAYNARYANPNADDEVASVAASKYWRLYVPQAFAMLGAIKEPTAAMKDAGQDGVYDVSGDTSPTEIWQAMIDSVLKEEV